ncbi:MAG: hypothetical protein ACJ0QH_05335 [Flavobacteriales bacterium]
MARHKLKIKSVKQQSCTNSTPKKVNTKNEVKNIRSGFIRGGFKIQK